jgi:thiosulfate/3-mercaptopyruvate sulfurtransferase
VTGVFISSPEGTMTRVKPILRVQELPTGIVFLDARSRDAYAEGHLEGARSADLNLDLSEPGDPARGGRHPLPPIDRWSRQLGAWGIGPSTDVVVYDDQNGASAAARAWWMLRAAGHERVSVLEGGYPSARANGLPVTTEAPHIDPLPPYPAGRWLRPTVGIDTVDTLRTDPNWKVLDVRGAPRFRGETEPFDPVAGHIPGALNLPYFENLAAADRFKSPAELRAQYEAFLGGTSPTHLVVHCGSGVTACHTLLALEAAGLDGASLYIGSWSEWCRSDRPQAKGEA